MPKPNYSSRLDADKGIGNDRRAIGPAGGLASEVGGRPGALARANMAYTVPFSIFACGYNAFNHSQHSYSIFFPVVLRFLHQTRLVFSCLKPLRTSSDEGRESAGR